VLDPVELLDAARLLLLGPAGAEPSDAQLRRAVSTAYYALFHTLLREAAQRFIGASSAASAGYAILYRGYSHGSMRTICEAVNKSILALKYQRVLGHTNIDQDLRDCASTFVALQAARHSADYDPHAPITLDDASNAIASANEAMKSLAKAPSADRDDFLALLLVGVRD